MGWSSLHRAKGTTDLDFFNAEYRYGSSKDKEIISCSSIRNVFYAAVRDTTSGTVEALVVLMQWSPKEYYNFSFKNMHECCMPYAFDAPAKILNLLTPTEDEYSNEWRAKCREVIARKAAAPKVTPGTTIKVPRAFDFTGGYSEDTFTYVGRRSVFRTTTGSLVRLPADWRVMSFELV